MKEKLSRTKNIRCKYIFLNRCLWLYINNKSGYVISGCYKISIINNYEIDENINI